MLNHSFTQTLLDIHPNGLVVSSPNGTILQANEKAREILGFNPKGQPLEQALGKQALLKDTLEIGSRRFTLKPTTLASPDNGSGEGENLRLLIIEPCKTPGADPSPDSIADLGEWTLLQEREPGSQSGLLNTILETMHEGLIVVDSEGKLYYANNAYCRITGRSKEDLLKEGWKITMDQKSVDEAVTIDRRIERGKIDTAESVTVYVRSDGTRVHTRRTYRPILWEGQRRVLISLVDITELKEAQAELERERNYWQEIFEMALNGMAVIDPVTLRHFEVNTALTEILGYSKEELLDPGFDVLKTFAPEDTPKVIDALKTVLATKAPFRYEVTHQRKDGGHRHVLVQISSLATRIGRKSERCLIVASDISNIKHQSDFLDGLFQISPVGLFTCDIETGAILEANPAFLSMLGYSKEEILEKSWYEITPPDIVQKELEENEALFKGEIPMIIREKVFFKKDGTEIPVILYFSKFFDPRAGKELYADFAVDISGMKKAQERLDKAYRYFKTIFDTASEMLVVFDPDGRVRDINRAAELLFGYSKEEFMSPDFDWRRHVHPDDMPSVLKAIDEVQKDNVYRRLEVRNIKKDGSEIVLLVSYTPIEAIEEGSEGQHILGIHVDITEIKRLESELKYLSFHDTLTGLYNRAYFEQELDRLSQGRMAPVSVVVADLDNLKPVNDTLGHAEGDELLKRTARILREVFRAEDIIARLGGDEFGVILVKANNEALEGAIKRLQKAIEKDNGNGSKIELSLSAGYAIAKETPFEPGALFQAADRAMYQTKLTKKHRLTNGRL
jgi:diguanylate cyclase (GGDEF)-like protein/PAS domain S-box-containing protein